LTQEVKAAGSVLALMLAHAKDEKEIKDLQKIQNSLPVLDAHAKKQLIKGLSIYQLWRRGMFDVLEEHFHIYAEEKDPDAVIRLYFQDFADPDEDLQIWKEQWKVREKTIPQRKLYISDLHFYHNSLNRQMDCRGFSGYEEMNRHMIEEWNKKVTKKDEVYILGDLSIAKGKPTNDIIHQLNGKLYLIEGNHDKYLEDKEFDRSLLKWIKPYAEISDNKRKVVLSHYPVFCYNGQYRKADDVPLTYMLYGHVHNTFDEVLVNRFIHITKQSKRKARHSEEMEDIPCQMINCFCMFSNYQPLTLDEWIETDTKRREKMAEDE